MQLKIFLSALSVLLLLPFNSALAEDKHFEPLALATETVFTSADNTFKAVLPALNIETPLDFYLFHPSSDALAGQLHPLSEIYSYYLYSPEVAGDIELTITLKYQGDNSYEKTVYYYNDQTKDWRLASRLAFWDQLTFKIKGRSNQLVITGKSIQSPVQSADPAASAAPVSPVYNFNVLAGETSELKAKEVCLPYLTGNLRAGQKNSPAEVKKLQTFLREDEGFTDLPTTGYFGNQTEKAIKEFQEKYAGEILKPWDLKKGTGLVLAGTLKKINQLYCQTHPDSQSYALTVPYELSAKTAKAAYLENPADGSWTKLESYDNVKSRTVTALVKEKSGRLALFEEESLVGLASWYAFKGGDFAASRDYPKGAKLKVINQSDGENQGKWVIVTINDYGPDLWTERMIDLDKAAFFKIANLKEGVVPVKIEPAAGDQ